MQRRVDRRERANDRRPQTHDQEHADRGAEDVKRDRGGCHSGGQRSDAVKQQRAACGHAHEQKPGAGGTMGERREDLRTRRVYERPDDAETLERVKAHAPFGSGRGAGWTEEA